MHVTLADVAGGDTEDEDTDDNGSSDDDVTVPTRMTAAHRIAREKPLWPDIMRAYRSLLVAIRAVSGFKPASAPDVSVSIASRSLYNMNEACRYA